MKHSGADVLGLNQLERNIKSPDLATIFGESATNASRTAHQVLGMVYLPPPQFGSATRPSYAEAYNKILASHRRSPLTSASSVIILVAPDVDALCAAKMLAELFKQDDVMHRIMPIAGVAELEKTRDELVSYTEVQYVLSSGSEHTLNAL